MEWKERVKNHLNEDDNIEEIDSLIKKLSKQEVYETFNQIMQDKFESEADEEEMEEFNYDAEEWYMSSLGDGSVEEETVETFMGDLLGYRINKSYYKYFKNQMIKKFPFLQS
jgi:hypothetical protein